VPKIETGAKTLRELATWIMTSDADVLDKPICVVDDGDVVNWHGVLWLQEDEVVFVPELTQEEYAEVRRHIQRQMQLQREQHWNRPEVLEAKEKGLLP
jgi:autonomous glycyl radical cofactor GrcA